MSKEPEKLREMIKQARARKVDLSYSNINYKARLSEFLDAEYDSEYVHAICGEIEKVYAKSCDFVDEATKELMLDSQLAEIINMEEVDRKKYMHSDVFKQDVKNGRVRGVMHNYFRTIDRRDMLEMFIEQQWNKKRLSFRVRAMLKRIATLAIESGRDSVVATAILPSMLKFVPVQVEGVEVSSWLKNNMIMTVLQVMVDANVLKIDVVEDKRTHAYNHMISIPFANEHLTVSLYETYRAVNGRRALLKEPASVQYDAKLVSTGSWYYKSPDLSDSVREFLDIQNQTKLAIYNDDDLLEKAIIRKYYDEKDAKGMRLEDMSKWQRDRAIDFYKELDDINEYGGFYVDHFIDSKYRSYEKSELFGVQQNSAARALVEFANKKPLNDVGRRAMRLDIACKAGYDKATEEEALNGFVIHEKTWREDPHLKREFSVLDSNEPTGFIIYQDATNSGTQMYAISTASRQLAKISGLLEGTRYDAYIMLAEELCTRLNVSVFNRGNVKSVFMVKLYNAGKQMLLNGKQKGDEEKTILEMMEADGIKKLGKTIPLQKTLKDYGYTIDDEVVWQAFDAAMSKIAPMALLMMEAIGQLPDKEIYEWIMDDGAVCQSARYEIIEEDVIWSNETGNRHHFIHRTKRLNKDTKKAALSPGIIHGMDSYTLRRLVCILADKLIETVTVHDSVGSHPNDTVQVRETYKFVLANMLLRDPMSNILEQLTGKKYACQEVVDIMDRLTAADIYKGSYALWA